jgi:roadblock/LC7 domain-containing protein
MSAILNNEDTTLAKIWAETAKLQAETAKIQAEMHEVNALTGKLLAEAAKLRRESTWYPVVVGTGLVAAGAAIAKFFT